MIGVKSKKDFVVNCIEDYLKFCFVNSACKSP